MFVFLFIFLFQKFSFCNDIMIPLERTIPIQGLLGTDLHLTHKRIVKLTEFQGKILATGLKEGQTQVRNGNKTYTLYVLEENKIKSYDYIKTQIKNMRGLELEIIDLTPTVKGELLRYSDWLKLSQSPGPFVMKVETDLEIQNKIKKNIHELLKQAELPIPTFSFFPQFQALIPKNKVLMSRYSRTLNSRGFEIIESDTSVILDPVVDLKVHIVEMKKSTFHKIGIDWPTSYSTQLIKNGHLKPKISDFDIVIHSLESDGEAKVLASPHLSCRSGKEASFLAGGEIPIKIMNYRTNDIQWKKHGILLNFKPMADRSGKISLYIKTEISLLDRAHTIDGVPGLLVNRVDSHIDLLSEQTIALSGLIKKNSSRTHQGFPALKDIPILGYLFSSSDYMEDRTDLIIFVTPKVVSEKDYL